MSAKDYVFQLGLNTAYLAKKIKNKSVMSSDRRIVETNEIVGLFEFHLKRFCIENKCATFEVRDVDGNVLFEASAKGKMLEEIRNSLKNK